MPRNYQKVSTYLKTFANAFFKFVQSPEAATFVFRKSLQKIWHDLPLSFCPFGYLSYNIDLNIILFRYAEILFNLSYGTVVFYALFKNKSYPKFSWVHLALYIVATMATIGSLILDFNLGKFGFDVKISFNALKRMQENFATGRYSLQFKCFM